MGAVETITLWNNLLDSVNSKLSGCGVAPLPHVTAPHLWSWSKDVVPVWTTLQQHCTPLLTQPTYTPPEVWLTQIITNLNNAIASCACGYTWQAKQYLFFLPGVLTVNSWPGPGWTLVGTTSGFAPQIGGTIGQANFGYANPLTVFGQISPWLDVILTTYAGTFTGFETEYLVKQGSNILQQATKGFPANVSGWAY